MSVILRKRNSTINLVLSPRNENRTIRCRSALFMLLILKVSLKYGNVIGDIFLAADEVFGTIIIFSVGMEFLKLKKKSNYLES
jgi:small neutral amino acid transporter SnatA (MarC family)